MTLPQNTATRYRRKLSRSSAVALCIALAVSLLPSTSALAELQETPLQISTTTTESAPDELVSLGDVVVLAAADDDGREPWVSDGTQDGTSQLRDIDPGSLGSDPRELTLLGDSVVFTATNVANGRELWITDGTSAGTTMLKDINPAAGSNPTDLTAVGSSLFFIANDGVHGRELWKTDGTTAGTALVKDLDGDGSSSTYRDLVEFDGSLFFVATDPALGDIVHKSDGTAAGTVAVGSESADSLFAATTGLWYTASSNLMRIESAAGVPVLVKSASADSPRMVSSFTGVAGVTVFVAESDDAGFELWLTNGTSGGTTMLIDIVSGTDSSNPSGLTVFNGEVYFIATDDAGRRNLWVTDGGTTLGSRTVSGALPGNAGGLTVVNDTMYMRLGGALYSSDGTMAGTMEIASDPLANGKWIAAAGDRLVYGGITVPDGEHELFSLTEVPGAPTGVTATAGELFASTVSWTAPTDVGPNPPLTYTVTASPGGATCTSVGTSCVVGGLAGGGSYTFVVQATNGIASEPSTTVVVGGGDLDLGACEGLAPTHVGTEGPDEIRGTLGDDIIVTLGGDDTVWGRTGNDIICVGDGNDRVFGGSGNNVLYGEAGIDKMRTGPDDTTLYGGTERDFLKGGHGNDLIYGEAGPDRIRGSKGNDIIWGGGDDDVMWGGPGDDILRGQLGDDLLKGQGGIDLCVGNQGIDTARDVCETMELIENTP